MFLIKIPQYCFEEISYILSIYFKDYHNCSFVIETHNIDGIHIFYNSTNKCIKINVDFFKKIDFYGWLNLNTLPDLPLKKLEISNNLDLSEFNISCIPIIFGNDQISEMNDCYYIGLDIFGSAFFMLTRYEEVVSKERLDSHNRFIFKNSIAFKEGFNSYPIINIYFTILTSTINYYFGVKSKFFRESEMLFTCDVDYPIRKAYYNLYNLLRSVANELLIKFKPRCATDILIKYFKNKIGIEFYDEYVDAIYQLNKLCSDNLVKSIFLFIPYKTSYYDEYVDFSSKKISEIIKCISDNCSMIGVHPGYSTYNDSKLTQKSVSEYNKFASFSKNQFSIFSRQHYLRWCSYETPSILENAGVKYDSTLGYAEIPGFRSGYCYHYTLYCLKTRKKLNLIEYPLVFMDTTVLSNTYLGLKSSSEIKYLLKSLIDTVLFFRGDFTFLFHNSNINSDTLDLVSFCISYYKKLTSIDS